VNVVTNLSGQPSKLEGPRKPVKVRYILDAWRYGGRWWRDEAPRDYYLLELETGHIVEIYQSVESWVLSRISD